MAATFDDVTGSNSAGTNSYTSYLRAHHGLSTWGKIFSKYFKITKTLGGKLHQPSPPPSPLDTHTPCTMVGDCVCLTRNWRKKLKILIMLLYNTDLNPCLNVQCPRFGVCKTYSAHDALCECFDQCPSYQDPVCTANGTTYDNRCWHELSYCRGLENNLVYHPGSCEGKANTVSIQ